MINMFLPNHHLKNDIIKLITYFDVFDYPLTSLEIWQLLPIGCSYQTVKQILTNINLEQKHGFYCLPQRQAIITTRQQRYNISDRKFKKALRIAKIFSYLPWIKLICLANLIGQHNLRTQGDIDLFIITTPQRLWLTRQLCVGLIKFLNLRPRPHKIQDQICLSFFVDAEHLNLESFLLQQAKDNRDRYFTYWLASLRPLYNCDQTYEQLLSANAWLNNYLPNWQADYLSHKRQLTYQTTSSKKFKQLEILEKLAKQFQYKVMASEIKKCMNQNTTVIVNDYILKLHIVDRRQFFYEKYLTNLKNHV